MHWTIRQSWCASPGRRAVCRTCSPTSRSCPRTCSPRFRASGCAAPRGTSTRSATDRSGSWRMNRTGAGCSPRTPVSRARSAARRPWSGSSWSSWTSPPRSSPRSRRGRSTSPGSTLPMRYGVQHPPPAVRRRPGPARRGPRDRPAGDRGGIPVRVRDRGGRSGRAGRPRVRAGAPCPDGPRLGAPAARRAADCVRAAHGRQRRGGARAAAPGAAPSRGVRRLDPPARAHRVPRPRESAAARLPGGGAGHVGRLGAGLSRDARGPGRHARAGGPGRRAAAVPRFAARGVPVPGARRPGDEPAGARRVDGPAGRAADGGGLVDRAVRRRAVPTEFRAAAPVRLDFAGAWTDVPPFSAREGGVVVNAAIALSAHVDLTLGGKLIRLVAEDLGQELECANAGGLVLDGRLDLLKAALRMFPVQSTCTLTTRSDAPPGSGLGSSGALDVALVAALARARGERLAERDVAEQAWYLETVEAKIPGGKQDQFAAALGGFHRLSFRDPDVGVEPITLDPAFAAALERQTVLCYTGRSRVSGMMIARVMAAYERGGRAVMAALRALRDVAEAMVEALRAADLARVAALLSENWKHQQALDPEMCTPDMARLGQALAKAGALGGKAAGAGAGGSMFFVTRDDPRPALAAARGAGATVLPVRWTG